MPSGTVAEHVKAERKTEHTFLEFISFKITQDWSGLPSKEEVESANEFLTMVEKNKDIVQIRRYSSIGLRKEADFLPWRTTDHVDAFQEIAADLSKTHLGEYLDIPYLWMAIIRPFVYLKRHISVPSLIA